MLNDGRQETEVFGKLATHRLRWDDRTQVKLSWESFTVGERPMGSWIRRRCSEPQLLPDGPVAKISKKRTSKRAPDSHASTTTRVTFCLDPTYAQKRHQVTLSAECNLANIFSSRSCTFFISVELCIHRRAVTTAAAAGAREWHHWCWCVLQ